MRFTLEIDLGNDAMHTREDIALALITVSERTTTEIADDVMSGDVEFWRWIRDDNGNTVGRFGIA